MMDLDHLIFYWEDNKERGELSMKTWMFKNMSIIAIDAKTLKEDIQNIIDYEYVELYSNYKIHVFVYNESYLSPGDIDYMIDEFCSRLFLSPDKFVIHTTNKDFNTDFTCSIDKRKSVCFSIGYNNYFVIGWNRKKNGIIYSIGPNTKFNTMVKTVLIN